MLFFLNILANLLIQDKTALVVSNFDYVIMDESSQVDIATGALAISCAKNAVIVGDSKQLEKVTTREEKEKYQEIFEKHKVPQMYNCADVSFLDSIVNIPAKINRHSGMAETARPEYREPL